MSKKLNKLDKVYLAMEQKPLQLSYDSPKTLSEANSAIEELLQLNKNGQAQLKAIHEHYQAKFKSYQATLRKVLNDAYGQSSEKFKSLFNEAEILNAVTECEETIETNLELGNNAENESSDQPKKERKKKRKILADHIPRKEVMQDLPETEKFCKADGSALVKIGEDVREELVYQPSKLYVNRIITPKYGCPTCHEGVVCACGTKRLIPGSVASPSILANLIVSKYVDHLPLYRQEQMFARQQVELSRATLASWVIKCGQAVVPLVNLIKDTILEQPAIQCDETSILVMNKDGVKKSSKSYMWVMGRAGHGRKAVLFELGPRRDGDVAERLLGDYSGYLQTDGLRSYDNLIATTTNKRLGCMAHVRRKFVEVLKSISKSSRSEHPAANIVKLISTLYKVEEKARETSLFGVARVELRQKESKIIFEQLENLVATQLLETGTKSPYGLGLKYASVELPKIKLYLANGECEIDNNLIENLIRPFALGRKNWLFSENIEGAESSAALYTLLQTAKLNDKPVVDYLEDVFEKLPTCQTLSDYEELLPWNWRLN